MATIFNPYKEGMWAYQGEPPSLEDHQIMLQYLRRLHHGIRLVNDKK